MPFVLLHGALLWKLAVVGAVLVVFGIVAIVRRLDARHWTRATVRSFDIPTDERVIRGVLGGGGATSNGETHTRAAELWIDTAEGRFVLAGAIRVLAGSRARGRFVAVSAGDKVIAHGTITRAPGPAAHYREDSTTFALTADGAAPILVAAQRPAVGVTPLSLGAKLWTTGATIVLSIGALCALGTYWHDTCGTCDDLTNTNACVLASATPGRDDTARLYETTWWGSRDRLAVARYVGDCEHLLDALEEHGAWDELAEAADRCGAPDVRQRALTELGRFTDAAALGHTHSGAPLGGLYILARRWDDAALHAERAARETHDRDEVLHWSCLALLLHAYGGGPVSPDDFAEHADCPAMRDELTGKRPIHVPFRKYFSWARHYDGCAWRHDRHAPVEIAQDALICARYDAIHRDRRIEVALYLWSQ
ncbi:MAG: hypothetical protein ABI678_18030 [Kofleriaceae bacterium]